MQARVSQRRPVLTSRSGVHQRAKVALGLGVLLALIALAVSCGGDDDSEPTRTPTSVTASATGTAVSDASPEHPDDASVAEILDGARSGFDDGTCADLGEALSLGAPIAVTQRACGFDGGRGERSTITIELLPRSAFDANGSMASSRGGAENEVCPPSYQFAVGDRYLVGIWDEDDGIARGILLQDVDNAEERALAIASQLCR